MKTISTQMMSEVSVLGSSGALLLLVEIALTGYSTLRYVRNNEDVVCDGDTYTAMAIEFGDIEETLQGDLPTIELKFGNALRPFAQLLEDTEGMRGGVVTIMVVHSDRLAYPPEIVYVFEVLSTEVDVNWVAFNMGIPNPLTKRFPRDRYVPSLCRHWFKGELCQFAGSGETCDHTLAQCRVYGNTLHFGGSPGIAEDVYG